MCLSKLIYENYILFNVLDNFLFYKQFYINFLIFGVNVKQVLDEIVVNLANRQGNLTMCDRA